MIAALGHTEVVDAKVAPTCTESGLTEGKHCSVCNDVLKAQEAIAALGHTEVVDAKVEPTCTESGLTEGKHCSICNKVFIAQEVINALGHTEVIDAKVEATCKDTGLTEGKHCSVCNEVLTVQEVIAALGHNHGDWGIKVEPTKENTGLEVKKCSRCDNEIENQITIYDTYLVYTLVNDEYYEVTGYNSEKFTGNEIVISSTFRGLAVVSISSEAFKGCNTLEIIKIPNSIKKISKDTFVNCTSLNELYYQDTKEAWQKVELTGDASDTVTTIKHIYLLDINGGYFDYNNNEEDPDGTDVDFDEFN